MSAPMASRLLQRASRTLIRREIVATTSRLHINRVISVPAARTSSRCFSVSSRFTAGLMPDTDNPQTAVREPEAAPKAPTEIDDEVYHHQADSFMNNLHERIEQIVETREDVEVDYHDGVLTVTFPPNGTYVINKQPPNKQIWLSSPISGPKRFDWTVQGEGIDEKEGSGIGDWVYLRDGTSLTDVVRKELGISVSTDGVEEVLAQKSSVDPVE